MTTDRQQLLDAHQKIIQAHLSKDVASWLDLESDNYMSVNRGNISYPTKAERGAQRQPYLEITEFSEYRDLVEPVVEISEDSTLGWLTAQVQATGIQSVPNGDQVSFESTWAWIELYKKQEGQWLCVGNISNAKPE